jgi:UDP-arabinose 4-epimerase
VRVLTKRYLLVTGGAGFIGSHTCKRLHTNGFAPVVYDNLITGNRRAVKWGPLIEADITDTTTLIRTLERYSPEAVIHFAASAYVGESVREPEKYYRNNVVGTLSVLQACRQARVKNLIFSSSCATYGVPATLPISEETPQVPINPYGRTKLIGEQMLQDYAHAYGLRYVALRYFNACGADPDGELGEWHDPETHLIPRALLVASGQLDRLEVYGDDYATDDGTCVRDYIHVSDLAEAHLRAAEHLIAGGANLRVNLGTGRGTSIREIVASVLRTTARDVPLAIMPRRAGDPPALFADASLAKHVLGFTTEFSDLDTIVRTAAPYFGLESRS